MADPEAPPTDDALRQPLRLLGLAGFASAAAMRWCDTLLPRLAAEFAVPVGQAGRTVAAFAVAYGLMQLVYGPLADRWGKLRVVGWAAWACSAAAFASMLAPGLGWLTLARAASGAAAAAVIPLTLAWVGDRVPAAQRQAVLARQMSATVSGMIAGQWLAGWCADHLGWRAGFGLLALLFAAAAWALQRHLRQPSSAAAEPASAVPAWRQLAGVLALPGARSLFALAAFEGAFAFSALAFAPSHLQARFGLSATLAGAVLAGYGLGGLLYSRGARWLLARGSAESVALAGAALVAGCWLALAQAGDWRWAPPLCIGAGLGFYMLHGLLQVQATQIAPAARGTAVSLFACALFGGQSLGVWAVSWGVDRMGPALALWLAAPALLAVGLRVRWAARRRPGPGA